MLIYVIRHGETEANVDGVFQGRMDGRLVESGYDLARVTGEALSGMGVKFDAAFTSPLMRARDTAQEVLAAIDSDVELVTDDRLLEIDMGDYEGKHFRPGNREVDSELCKLFFEDAFSFPGFPNGEDACMVCERTQAFLWELSEKDFSTVLVSTHGFALRAMLNRLYENPSDFWQGHVPYNCSVSIVEADDGGLRLIEGDKVYYDSNLCIDRYASY